MPNRQQHTILVWAIALFHSIGNARSLIIWVKQYVPTLLFLTFAWELRGYEK